MSAEPHGEPVSDTRWTRENIERKWGCSVCGRECQGSGVAANNGNAVCGYSGEWKPFG